MQSREEPLTHRERRELEGYVSASAVVVRAILFVLALTIVGALSRRFLPGPYWMLPTALAAVGLYVRSRRWTGGAELRQLIRNDLTAKAATVHHVVTRDAITFEEAEDEGPIVFILTDTGETLVFVGQDLARDVARGFPWRELEIRESARSRRFLGLKRLGEPFAPSAKRPPLSREAFLRLALGSVSRWARLEIPFEELRRLG